VSLSFADGGDANLCLDCHQGRASASTVAENINAAEMAAQQADTTQQNFTDDTPVPNLYFTDIHYFPSGVTVFGTESKGAYEYEGKQYASQFMHVSGYDTCTGCHGTHDLQVKEEACAGCHGVNNPDEITFLATQGDKSTPIASQMLTMQNRLLSGIQVYATQILEQPIAFAPGTYPYFFNDLNGNGTADPDETAFNNRYVGFSPRLERATYNFFYSVNDPGAYAHNGAFILQVLYDTIDDLGQAVSVDISGLVRP